MSSLPLGTFLDDNTGKTMSLSAPPGKFRVISYDSVNDDQEYVGDFDTLDEVWALPREVVTEGYSAEGDEFTVSKTLAVFDDQGNRVHR